MAKKRAPLILLVDDDPLIRGLGQELLEHLGYRVETAGDGSEALKNFRAGNGWTWWFWTIAFRGRMAAEVLKGFKTLDKRARVLVASGFCHPRIWPASRRRGPWA